MQHQTFGSPFKSGAVANGFAKKMEQLETALMTVIWHTVLDRCNSTSASLQKADIYLLTAVKLYQSLITFVEQMRETIDDMEIKAKSFADNPEYKQVGVLLKLRNFCLMKAILLTLFPLTLWTNLGSKLSTVSLNALILNCESDGNRLLNAMKCSV